MPKNFGVNRLERVILYDYDDLADLVAWNFRKLPEPPEWAETMPSADWMSKDEWDVSRSTISGYLPFPQRPGRPFCDTIATCWRRSSGTPSNGSYSWEKSPISGVSRGEAGEGELEEGILLGGPLSIQRAIDSASRESKGFGTPLKSYCAHK